MNFCEIHENGNLEVKVNTVNLLSKNELTELVETTINTNILVKVSNFLKQKGYQYITFKNFDEPNIYINNLTYKFSVPNSKKITSKIIGCLTPIFNVNTTQNKSKSTGVTNLNMKTCFKFSFNE